MACCETALAFMNFAFSLLFLYSHQLVIGGKKYLAINKLIKWKNINDYWHC
jgi:hypothetical protein